MLSFGVKQSKRSVPVGYVNGGNDDETLIFITTINNDMTAKERIEAKEKKTDSNIIIKKIISQEDLNTELKRIGETKITSNEYKTIEGSKMNNIFKNERINKIIGILKDMKGDDDDKLKTNEIKIYDGLFQQIPKTGIYDGDSKMVFRTYIAGPSECGKSTYCASLIKEYKDYHPKNKIILFSDTKKDKLLDGLITCRISIDKDLVEGDPIEPEDIHDSLVIFDDIDSISNKKYKKVVSILRDKLLQAGRHEFVSVITTGHQICNYIDTRVVLNDSQYLVLFPEATGRNKLFHVLKTYFGLDAAEIEKAVNLPSRWICVHKEVPRFIAYSGGIYML